MVCKSSWVSTRPFILYPAPNNSRFSFGGNRVQIKAETHVLSDIQSYIGITSEPDIPTTPSLKSLKGKQELLSLLLSSEQTRLMVWLFPLDYEKKHHFTSGQHSKTLADVGFMRAYSFPIELTPIECNPRSPKNRLGRKSLPCRPSRSTLPVSASSK